MGYHVGMGKPDKDLEAMRRNPAADWKMAKLQTIARRFGVEWRQPGTSHVTFRAPKGQKLTVPAGRPIKPVYIRRFLEFIDEVSEE